MRRSILSLIAAATLTAGVLAAGHAAAQPADMEAFDAEEAARGRPSLAWSHPVTGLAPGSPLPRAFGPAHGGEAVGSGYFGAGPILFGSIIVAPGRGHHGLRPDDLRPDPRRRPGLHPHGDLHPRADRAPPRAFRDGYRHGFRKGYRKGRRDGRAPRDPAAARSRAPGGVHRGGSVRARPEGARRNAAKLRRARDWSYY